MWPMGGGEPPDEDKSELLGGERERLSAMLAVLSSHCWQPADHVSIHIKYKKKPRMKPHSRESSAYRLILEG